MFNKFAGISATHCDKCGRPVEQKNDAVVIEALAFGASVTVLFSQSRHFLPVVENGEVVCEGSPSRAQYIEGQPRDKRGYKYIPEYEDIWRKSYAAAQELK